MNPELEERSQKQINIERAALTEATGKKRVERGQQDFALLMLIVAAILCLCVYIAKLILEWLT